MNGYGIMDVVLFIIIALSALCVPLWLVLNFKKRKEEAQRQNAQQSDDINSDIYTK